MHHSVARAMFRLAENFRIKSELPMIRLEPMFMLDTRASRAMLVPNVRH